MYSTYTGYGWDHSPDRSGTESPPIRAKVAAARRAAEPPVKAPKAAAVPMTAAAPAPAPAIAPKPQATAVAATGKPKRPQGLAKARGGKADNLQIISGVGPKLEKTLNGLGFYHFDQIGRWKRDEIDWIDEHLRFKGRIDRDKWIDQAKLLAAGDMEAFSKRFGPGKRKS